MGNDGGTIVKKIKGEVKAHVDTTEDEEYTVLTTCYLSSLPLYNQPVVSDYLGRLYSKEKILENLLEKDKINKDIDHINSIRDVIDLKISWKLINSKYYIECPVSHITKVKNSEYSYLRTCGCVVSYKLLTNLPTNNNCPNCDTHFDKYDIVLVNPMKNQQFTSINTNNFNHLQQQGLTHSKTPKKIKKRKLNSTKNSIKLSKKIKN